MGGRAREAGIRKRDFSRDAFHRDIGRCAGRPFSILAVTYHTTLGDLVAAACFAATVRGQFDHGRLRLVVRPALPFGEDLISLVPGVDEVGTMPGDWPGFLLRRFPRLRPWGRFPLDVRKRGDCPVYDLVITDHMASARTVGGLPNPVRLRVPGALAGRLDERLEAAGLDPSRWFAVIHYREDTYRGRPKQGVRSSEPGAFVGLCEAIIDRLGGQVVRVGHPGMTPFPARTGFVDLAGDPGGVLLHARAIERARFMVAGPSGPIALAWGMHTPCALVDATDNHGGWGPALQWVLTHTVTPPDGRPLRNRALQESGLFCSSVLSRKMRAGAEYRIAKATGSELTRVAERLMEATEDTTGWRSHQAPPQARPNEIRWPVRQEAAIPFFDP